MNENLDDAEFLRYLAQNDYMIDSYYLPDGERLMKMADQLDELLKVVQEICE
jgi:hypothetical protein